MTKSAQSLKVSCCLGTLAVMWLVKGFCAGPGLDSLHRSLECQASTVNYNKSDNGFLLSSSQCSDHDFFCSIQRGYSLITELLFGI